jgi:hypothetical protein
MEPDFKALALAWVDGDVRSADLKERDPDRREQLAARLAEALDRRRRDVARQPFEGGNLIVRVPEDRLTPKGMDADALDQLEQLIQEHHRQYPD